MVYFIVKHLVWLTARIYFRKIHIYQKQGIDFSKPTLLASNHPNAFLDAMLIGSLSPKTMYFIVRGDIFNTPLKSWLLSLLNMYPIYRTRDGLGFQGLKQNNDMFDFYKKILAENGCILIFSEGLGVLEKRLRPIQKGTARLAYEFANEYPNGHELQIVPMGINYTHMLLAEGEFMMAINQPIRIEDFSSLEKVKAVNDLTEAIKEGIGQYVIHIDEKEDDLPAEYWLEINRNEVAIGKKWQENNKTVLEIELTAIDSWNQFRKSNIQLFLQWKEKLNSYFQLLDKSGLRDEDIKRPPFFFQNAFMAILGSPFLFWTWLVHSLPFLFTAWFTKKLVKKKEFIASIKMAGGMFITVLWYILLGEIIHLISGSILTAFIITTLHYPVLLITVDIKEHWRKTLVAIRIKRKQGLYFQAKEKRQQLMMLPFKE